MADKYPLAALLQLRERRYDDAVNVRQLKQQAVTAAVQTVQLKEQELAAYRQWKREEIDRRYVELMGKVLSQKALAEFNQGISALDAKEASLETESLQAQQSLQQAQLALQQAQAEVLQKRKAAAKLQRHREIFLSRLQAEQEQRAECELEDFMPQKPQF